MEHGRVIGWMPASEVPAGATRRGHWWVYSESGQIEVCHRYPEDALSNQEHLGAGSKALGIQPDARIAEKRMAAARTLNRDIEAYLAHGLSLSSARAETLKTANEVLQTIILGTAIIIASFPFAAGAEITEATPRPRGARAQGAGGKGTDGSDGLLTEGK